ncbi:MAG: TMEM43 family protein [Pseudomonadales bacterium]
MVGKLIHVKGTADTRERLRDELFGIDERAIRLVRKVEMFQWVERESGRHTRGVTSYSYRMKWDTGRNDHREFSSPAHRHKNPDLRFKYQSQLASRVNVGGYFLNRHLKRSIRSREYVDWTEARLNALPLEVRQHAFIDGQFLYWSEQGIPDPESPQLGDHRVRIYVVRPSQVSLIATPQYAAPEQLVPYMTSNGEEVEGLLVGNHTAAEVFERMHFQNVFSAWLFRFAGFLLGFLGCLMILDVLIPDSVPIPVIGKMLGVMGGLVALLLAIALTAVTIALAWIAVRPMLAIPLILIGIATATPAWRISRKQLAPVSLDGVETPTA